MNNQFALGTLNYIWTHPNCQNQKIQSLWRFFKWQLNKRLTHHFLDFQLTPDVKVRCYPDSRSASAALYCGLYDYDEMHFLLRYLRPEDTFLDIGANIGIYTLLAATKLSRGRVYSFEPLPKNYDRLKENLELNHFQQVEAYPIAISHQTGSVALDPAGEDALPFITSEVTQRTISVMTDTLERILPEESLQTLVLAKIDIEGAEILAFKGATALLQNHRPPVWILEINDAVHRFGYTRQDVVDFLQKYGYSLYRYDVDANQIYPITLQQKQGNNVLAIANTALAFVQDRLAEERLGASLSL
jgi:FkbM family methyltransferase